MGISIELEEKILWMVSFACFFGAFCLYRLGRFDGRSRGPGAVRKSAPSVAGTSPPIKPQAPPAQDEGFLAAQAGASFPSGGTSPAAAPEADLLPATSPLGQIQKKDRKIGEILLSHNFVTKETLEKALKHQKEYGGTITQFLLHFGYINEKQLAQCLASQFKVPYLPLDAYQIADEIVRSIPVDIAEKYWVMPVDKQGDSLMVVMIDPLDAKVIKELEEFTGLDIVPFVGIISEIQSALRFYYKVFMKDEGGVPLVKMPPYFIDTKTYAGPDRRKAIRYRSKIDIRFPVGGQYKKTQTFDVGRGGFGFLCDKSLELGAVVTLEINLPREVSPLPISAVTQVVRCVRCGGRKFEIGVKTLKISQKENELVINYASRHRE